MVKKSCETSDTVGVRIDTTDRTKGDPRVVPCRVMSILTHKKSCFFFLKNLLSIWHPIVDISWGRTTELRKCNFSRSQCHSSHKFLQKSTLKYSEESKILPVDTRILFSSGKISLSASRKWNSNLYTDRNWDFTMQIPVSTMTYIGT